MVVIFKLVNLQKHGYFHIDMFFGEEDNSWIAYIRAVLNKYVAFDAI